ncbi:hypothetical protein [Paraburkholderia phytofirmans]|uniref:Uncharacterized protein n=1 Tax=Paraburkholderia phytofirmans OLGA172 TaxID=1417228 RepID=A0A161I6M9_9BURK|nr:hypothetical protein [Paraburkholderia phytofirmans]ANB72853.1 hypothetical protein AYM40_11090 [Paraburkholderia phytofirmans OLGA172]
MELVDEANECGFPLGRTLQEELHALKNERVFDAFAITPSAHLGAGLAGQFDGLALVNDLGDQLPGGLRH